MPHSALTPKPGIRVCVFCGSRPGSDPAYLGAARQTGRLIGEAGWTLVYGGGALGLMGAVCEAAIAAGAPVTGVRPDSLAHLEMPRQEGIKIEIVADLFERKRRMIELADAFIVLPGGLGTLDELLEVITTAQLGQHAKPVAVVNIGGLFDGLAAFAASAMDAGFIYGDPARLYRFVPTADAAMAFLASA